MWQINVHKLPVCLHPVPIPICDEIKRLGDQPFWQTRLLLEQRKWLPFQNMGNMGLILHVHTLGAYVYVQDMKFL